MTTLAGVAVVYEAEARKWATPKSRHANTIVPGTLRDDGEVLQISLAPSEEPPSSGRFTSVAVAVRDEDAEPEVLLAGGPIADHVLLIAPAANGCRLRAWSRDGARWREREILRVGALGEAFARHAGILENRQLAGAEVAVIGLGSGGAPIVSELAKAGVGSFVLIDRDRIEVTNVGRHLCDLTDLGRRKTAALRDRVLARNPDARVTTWDGDITSDPAHFRRLVANAQVLIGATDNNDSRRLINRVAVETGRPALFGRAFRRACGGDVIRVRPGGPCYECLVSSLVQEEVSSRRSGQAPAYSDTPVRAEPGLSLDIAPISLFMARLALQELVRGSDSTLVRLDEDLEAPLFIWANRREEQFSRWTPMRFSTSAMTVQRWYGVRAAQRKGCPVCDEDAFLADLEAQVASA